MNREIISLALNSLDDRHISDTATYSPGTSQDSPERIVHMKKKRIITLSLAAVLMLALGLSAYAIWGIPRYTGTHQMPKAQEYHSLSELPKIEKDVGFPVTVPESFSNGYTFSVLRVDGEAVFGESYEVLKEYYVVHASYTKDNAQELYLHLSPVMEIGGSSDTPVRTPSEQLNVSGVTVSLNLDHYKVVPEDYQKTEDDLASEVAGHYYVSFGSEEIEEYDMAFASFSLGDVNYTLMDMKADEDSFTTLAQMAKEIIEESKA